MSERPSVEQCSGKATQDTVKNSLSKDPLRFEFNIPIGDWSGDGHGKFESFHISCNKPLKEVIKAFKNARKKLPNDTAPTSIFEGYEDYSLTSETYLSVFNAGYDLLSHFNTPTERKRRLKKIPSETWDDILKYPQIYTEDYIVRFTHDDYIDCALWGYEIELIHG